MTGLRATPFCQHGEGRASRLAGSSGRTSWNQNYGVRSAPHFTCIFQLQTDSKFGRALPPHPNPLPQGKGEPHPAPRITEALWTDGSASEGHPLPEGEGTPVPALCPSQRADNVAARRLPLPLPKGWGEGEGGVFHPAVRFVNPQNLAPVMHLDGIFTTGADFRTPNAAFERGVRINWQVRIADQNQRPVPAAITECELVSPNGDVLEHHKAMSGTDGTALFSRALPPDVASGRYRIRVKAIAHADWSNAIYKPASNLQSAAEFEVR